ncbi:hypothetical protein Aple_057850 [Acrocarpospora pleiomorpha]|uniref:non-specific serine/threonine protein kinase n=1 Tax=Acrocarpospora pleiomorpha TaxID=90975 RepID=A0A5M3XQ55_9ACTN|nr:hypothetical protein [Acrocarpospora pleiomorpha]GES22886.1 hypothetical protein Aple_057850 [Acrocarpospora pleiomorpha]
MADPDIAWPEENLEQVDGEGGEADVGDGANLRLLIREEGATGFAAALLVLKGALIALAADHRDGAAHPDLAPENVIVTPAGGIRLVADPAEAPAYKAPELWRGAPASPASDIYAVTAVFFECLTGGPPFDAAAAARLGWLHRTVPPPVEQVPEGLRRLVERGLSKAPQHRPSSAAAFAAEVEAVAVAALGPDWERPGRVALAALASSHASAVPEEPVEPPAPRPSRVKVATLVALAAAAVVVVAVSAGDRPSRQSYQAAQPQPRPAVTLLPTPSLVTVQPAENSEPLPVHHKPVVIAEETGAPRTAKPRKSSTPTPTAKDDPSKSHAPSAEPEDDPATVPDGESKQPPPPASEPTSAPILEVEASVELPILGGNGLDVSVGVQTGLLGLSL